MLFRSALSKLKTNHLLSSFHAIPAEPVVDPKKSKVDKVEKPSKASAEASNKRKRTAAKRKEIGSPAKEANDNEEQTEPKGNVLLVYAFDQLHQFL